MSAVNEVIVNCWALGYASGLEEPQQQAACWAASSGFLTGFEGQKRCFSLQDRNGTGL